MIGDSKTLKVHVIGPFVTVTAKRKKVGVQSFGNSLQMFAQSNANVLRFN